MLTKIMNCPQCKVGVLKDRKGKFGDFKGCSNYPTCKYTFTESKSSFPDNNQPPATPNNPPVPSEPQNRDMVLLEAIDGINARFDALEIYLRDKLN